MAISTYGELKAAVAHWLERDDFTARIPEFIALAQSELYRGDPPLRIGPMLASADLVMSGGQASAPSGWLEFNRLRLDAQGVEPLRYIAPERFGDLAEAYQAGPPVFYTIEGDTLSFAPTSDYTIRASYYKPFTVMSADSDADWIVTNAPHVYLDGALYQAFTFEGTMERAQMHRAKFLAGVLALNGASAKQQASGTTLVMRRASVA